MGNKPAATIAITIILIALIFSQSANAQVKRSECGPGDPLLGQQTTDLIPWFADLERKLKDQPDYKQFKQDFLDNKNTLSFEVYFDVTDKGSIVNPTIRFASDSSLLDESFLTLLKRFLVIVKDVGPLSPPPNNLPVKRGVQVTFIKVLVGEKKFASLGRGLKSID